ncbi:MAG: c-type cytochrome [Candidatus Nanopelagicales bacterium]|nr:c-type cytochrome [Candidatus Nanopelagicales bacterium]
MKFLAARRRNPLVAIGLLLFALLAVGGGYAAIASVQPAQASASSQTQVEEGKQLFLSGCSSCHGLEAQGTANGPTMIGVGAAAVDFQVASGRMPMAAPGAQAGARPTDIYTQDQIDALAAYVASLAPGPANPTAEDLDFSNADVAEGGVLFRTNCAQCHQAAGQGGALTQGKYAPNLMAATPREMYQAMVTGPQSMPVFSNETLPVEDKQAIMAYVTELQTASSPGGLDLGRIGPVAEGLFLWTAVFAALIGAAVWIGIKAR